jgi:ribosomal protein L37AE/L43A
MRHRENIEDDEWFLRDECDTRTISVGIKIKKKKKEEKEAKMKKCPNCGAEIEWIDKARRIWSCPKCGACPAGLEFE